ncbi:ArpU family phage packaging/lysis transcriptional regulator [Lactobacillus intestinalis]|uniref:ArpU family phage packaging/lysis transcriptional regulator n=1 Tax=Lactobacillus intestinalis TaxID=151781 RepID=UPI0026032D3A|nr:ArpU family phage packaging/lysis transcriptional regulator [Lactobacillus intestinalis]
MSLWKMPDPVETADNVDAFLKGQITRLAMQAGVSLVNLSSPKFNSLPSSGTAINGTENKIQHGLEAMEALQAIRYTMDQTYGISPQILIKYYIKQERTWKIRQELFIDHDSFPKLKQKALCEFADCWVRTLDKFEWEKDDRIDLHVFPSSTENVLKFD